MTDETPEERAQRVRRERYERLAKAMGSGRNILEAADMVIENGKKKLPPHPVIASSEWGDTHLIRPRYGNESGFPIAIATHARLILAPYTTFAMHCIERWALIAGEIDGEDSAGRQKFRRMTADEVVGHACDVAEKAYAEFEKRGWITKIPSMAELADKMKDAEDSNS